MLEVKNVTKKFKNVIAVSDLSFEASQGEVIGLLGPNGAGKTTTMRLITGFFTPDSGEVLIDNLSVSKQSLEVRELIGYLPENNPLYKDMLVKDFLNFSAKLSGVNASDIASQIDYSVNSVNISNVYYRTISELSKGYKQRVGLAAAIIHKPKYLILDEPTEGLDPIQRSEIRNLISDLSQEHLVILSTHVLQEVENMCSRVVIINQGKKIYDEKLDRLNLKTKSANSIDVELEGSNIEKVLTSNDKITVSALNKLEQRYRAVLASKGNFPVQSELSRLSAQNNWIIWNLKETSGSLEAVFNSLKQSTFEGETNS